MSEIYWFPSRTDRKDLSSFLPLTIVEHYISSLSPCPLPHFVLSFLTLSRLCKCTTHFAPWTTGINRNKCPGNIVALRRHRPEIEACGRIRICISFGTANFFNLYLSRLYTFFSYTHIIFLAFPKASATIFDIRRVANIAGLHPFMFFS